METHEKADVLFPLLLQVLPHLQTSWQSAGHPRAPPLSGGRPPPAPGGWRPNHSPSQQQRRQDALVAEGSEGPGPVHPGFLHSHHADVQQVGSAAAAAQSLPGGAAAAQSHRGVEQCRGEATRGLMELSGAAPRARDLQTPDHQQDEKSAPGLP